MPTETQIDGVTVRKGDVLTVRVRVTGINNDTGRPLIDLCFAKGGKSDPTCIYQDCVSIVAVEAKPLEAGDKVLPRDPANDRFGTGEIVHVRDDKAWVTWPEDASEGVWLLSYLKLAEAA